jgi:hypothetical protein
LLGRCVHPVGEGQAGVVVFQDQAAVLVVRRRPGRLMRFGGVSGAALLLQRPEGPQQCAAGPQDLLGADGDPEALLTERPSAVQYAAAFTLEAEQALRRLAVVRGAHHLAADDVHAWLDANAPTIGPDQRAAVVGIASCDAALTVLVGPAGTGKSYAAGALAGAWSDLTGGRLIGLATSEAATTVLRDDGITHAANVAAFLAATVRLEAGSTRPTDLAWRLGPTDVGMVDEASMVSTKDLDVVRERVQASGARLVLTGDPHQLAAVSAGGAMDLVSDRAETFTLTEVRRFAEPWEREASLRLRQGDVDALAEYTRHARLVAHDSPEDAVQAVARAAVADLVDGREVLAVAGSNALAADVARHMRAMLIDLGRVQDGPEVQLGRDDNAAGVGDLVQARRIDRVLGLTNRENYQVTAVGDDGSLDVVSVRTGEMRHVPAGYVAADMQLAYAATVHAAQGRTVDACHYLTDHRTDIASLYVGGSRGRIRNTTHVISPVIRQDDGTLTRPGADAVLARAFTREQVAQAALVAAETDAERRESMDQLLGQIETLTRTAVRTRTERHLDDLADAGLLTEDQRARLCADQATDHLSRLLRATEQAGHDPREVLRQAVEGRSLDRAQSLAQVIAARIAREHGIPAPAATGVPADLDPDAADHLTELHARVQARTVVLGERTAQDPPAWALDRLGPVPAAGTPERAGWEQRAGVIAAHREATGFDDPHRAIGAPPTGPHATERRAAHLAAWEAAGRPHGADRDAAMLTNGQILIRLRAAQHMHVWAPPNVDPALRAAEQARERARQEAALATARAEHAQSAGDVDEAEQHRQLALRHEANLALHEAAVADLTLRAQARTEWLTAALPTLAERDRVQGEADSRGLAPGAEDDQATTTDWMVAEAEVRQAEDAHRAITDTDLHDTVTDQDRHWLDQVLADLAQLPETPPPALVQADLAGPTDTAPAADTTQPSAAAAPADDTDHPAATDTDTPHIGDHPSTEDGSDASALPAADHSAPPAVDHTTLDGSEASRTALDADLVAAELALQRAADIRSHDRALPAEVDDPDTARAHRDALDETSAAITADTAHDSFDAA